MSDRPKRWQRIAALILVGGVHLLSLAVLRAQAIDPRDTASKDLTGSIYPSPWGLILQGVWLAVGILALTLALRGRATRPWLAAPILLVLANLAMNLAAAAAFYQTG